MVHVKPDLSPRQMLWGIASDAQDIASCLYEVALYDSTLWNDDRFHSAYVKLKDAAIEMLSLRARATAESFSILALNFNSIDDLVKAH